MALWDEHGKQSGAPVARAAKTVARVAPAARILLLASIISCAAAGQSPSPTPATESGHTSANSVAKGDAGGQEEAAAATRQQDGASAPVQQKDDKRKKKDEKRGSIVVAPIPVSSPAFGSGLLMVFGYVFQFDKKDEVSPPSWLGGAGLFTNNGSRGLALGGRLYLKENKYQTTFAFIKGRANYDFFGTDRFPNRPAVSIPLSINGDIFFGEAMRNVGKSVFVGPRYQYRLLRPRLNGERRDGGFEIPPIDLTANSAALGFHVQRDLRNSTFYPTKGTLLDFTADYFAPAFGSRRQYQVYKVAYNGFHEIANRQVLAYRAMACTANGSVPFYDLCMYGFNSDLRGYTTGEFQNRRMFATQAEYRLDWRKRLGFVAFGGVGGVAREWGALRSDGLLPSAGAGLRFKLDKKNHINYRIDFGFGREGRTLSIGVGEAF